jgi:23S rRNA (uracil-5-)-methyltransferase RumA
LKKDLKSGQVLELNIEKVNTYGVGIAREDGSVFEVPKSLEGEKVRVKLEKSFQNGKFWKCSLQEVLRPSPGRVDSYCAESRHCAGCGLDFLPYEQQLELKNAFIRDFFPAAQDIIPCSHQWHYRNNLTFVLKKDDNRIVGGVYSRKNEKIYPFHNCAVSPEPVYQLKDSLLNTLNKYATPIEGQPSAGESILTGVTILYSFEEKTLLLVLSTRGEAPFLHQNEILEECRAQNPKLTGIYHKIEDKTPRGFYHRDRIIHLWGEKFLIDRFPETGVKYRLTPTSLIYPNPFESENLYTWLQSQLPPSKRILELYCGSGVGTLHYAQKSKMVYAIEKNKRAIQDAVFNARLNRLENIIFIQKEIEKFFHLRDIAEEELDILILKSPGIVVTDQSFMKMIQKKNFQKIIYLSSHPQSMKTDLENMLSVDYHLKTVQPFDMFPQNHHMEVAAVLEKKRKIKIFKPKK